LWRGAVDWPAFLTGRSMVIAGGMAAKLVVYPIAEGTRPDRRLTNWAVVARISDGSTPPPNKEDWSRMGRFEELMPHVQRFRIPYVNAQALIEATPEFWEYPMCDRDPLPRWSHGRVTLLGDAAHPMYPVGSNGASQAILDARCLADRLCSAEHVLHALWLYEQERLPMTAQIVRMNRKGGPEGVIDAVEERAPDGFARIDDVLSFVERARGRYPEEALHGLVRLVEDAVGDPHRQPDQVAGAGHEILAVDQKVEPAFEHVDELLLGRMDVRRHERAGGKRRVPGERM